MYFLGSEWIIRVLLHLWLNVLLYWLTHHGAGWRVFDDTRGGRQVWLCDLDGLTTGGCGEVLVQLKIWPCHWSSTLTLRASGKPATGVCQQESYLKCKRWDGITKKPKQNSPVCFLGVVWNRKNDNARRNFIPQILCFLSGRWLYFSDESPWQVHPWRQRSQRRREQQSRPAINPQDRQEILVWLAIGIHRLLPSFCR